MSFEKHWWETCIGRMGRERSEEYIPMDLMDKLASVAQRYEELNSLMAQPEVLEDLSLLQRYGREPAELEEVVRKYQELLDNDRQISEAQEMYESDDPEMSELAYEELERLKTRKQQFL